MDEQTQMPDKDDLSRMPAMEETGQPQNADDVETKMPDMDFGSKVGDQAVKVNPEDMNEAEAEAMMLKMMEEESKSVPVVEKANFEQLKNENNHQTRNIDMLMDVTLPVSIELGRTSLKIEDILSLGPGSVVELDKLAGEPVDVLVNDRLLAKGEVVVIDENFGVRITSMISPQDRIKSLR